MVWFSASYGVAILGYLGVSAVGGRWLGPESFGHFVVALNVTGLVAQFGLGGVNRSGLREAARLRDAGDADAMGTLRNGVRAVLLTLLPFAAIVTSVVVWFTTDVHGGTRLALALSMGALVLLNGHQKVWANYLRGLGYVRLASLVEGRSGGALVASLQALLMLGVWVLLPDSGLTGALVAVAIGFAVPVLWARQVVHAHWSATVGPAPSLIRDLRATLRRDWRFVSVQVATYLNISIELWLAALVLSRTDTSMFSAGLRMAQLLMLPMTALQVVFAPALARLTHDASRRHAAERLLRTGATVAFVLTMGVLLPMLVAPHLVVRVVYGPGFADAVPLLLLLCIGFVVNVLMGLSGTTLSMAGREGVGAKVQWVGVGLRCLLAYPAAKWGGAAWLAAEASLVSSFVFIFMWVRTRQVLGVSTHVTVRPDLQVLRQTTS
jgi:O-antigen/teichoic acid export membrane protein